MTEQVTNTGLGEVSTFVGNQEVEVNTIGVAEGLFSSKGSGSGNLSQLRGKMNANDSYHNIGESFQDSDPNVAFITALFPIMKVEGAGFDGNERFNIKAPK